MGEGKLGVEGEIADVRMPYSVAAVAGSWGSTPLGIPGGGTSELSEHGVMRIAPWVIN